MKKGKRIFDLSPYEFIKFFFASAFPNLSRKLHLTIFKNDGSDFFLNAFLQTFDYREKNDTKRTDFVSMLLALKNSYKPKELAAEAFLVYTGGFETSSALISFTAYELARNPTIQERLREEIKNAIDENDGKLTYEMIFGLKYLDQVFNESLRKYPPIPNVARRTTKDYSIPGTELLILKGTDVFVPTYSLHHDPEYYPEPEKFDPERFAPENDVRTLHPFTFLPFGEGPRNCMGMRFGMMQSKIAVAKILQNFTVTTNEKTQNTIKFIPSNPFLIPVGGLSLNFEKIA